MPPIIMERKKCPKCKKGRLHARVPRGFLVKTLLFWLPIKRYRCESCDKKSYVFESSTTPAEKVI